MARNHSSLIISSCILGISLVSGAWTVSGTLRDMRMMERMVTVKGLAERDVMSDMGVWNLSTSAAGEELAITQMIMENNISAIKKFLIEKGFKEEELSLPPLRVFDRKAAQYGEQKEGQARYIIQGSVSLRTSNVTLLQDVSRLTNELVRAGITLSQEGGCASPVYMFTKLNDVKPEMLVEATQNARKAAEQFAADSGSKVGKIKQALQGSFSITERDDAVASGSSYNEQSYCKSDPNKRLRVVTTVDYYLQ